MADEETQSTYRNLLLSALPEADLEFLRPHLEYIDLPINTQMETPNREIRWVYFPESGFASAVANGIESRSIEVGMIGREGITAMAVLMGTDRSPVEMYMQADGSGHRIAVGRFREIMRERPSMRDFFLMYAHTFSIQSAQTCLANGRGKLEERLSRWLLMAQDRVGGDQLALTHQFLSFMLGVRRPGVSITLKELEMKRAVRMKRGLIIVVDRDRLRQLSNGTYGVAEAEYARVFGVSW